MSFLDRSLRRGVARALGNAVSEVVRKAVEPTATTLANQAADSLNTAAGKQQETAASGGFAGAMANLERSLQGYATEAAKNMKVCSNCNKSTTADKKFCPDCGTQLPEQTVAQSTVCPSCGKQNVIGTKFCQDCGAKLPVAIAEEQAAAEKAAQVMRQWEEKLPQYPKWNCGGTDFVIDDHGQYMTFSARFLGSNQAVRQSGRQAVDQYRQLLLQNGFRQAGQHPCPEHLYKRVNGVVYHVDTEHCFESDSGCPTIGFDQSEPNGGFDYVKPEPRKSLSLRDLFR